MTAGTDGLELDRIMLLSDGCVPTGTGDNCESDVTNPSGSITAPTTGSTVSGTSTISVSANDNDAVDHVEFYLYGSTLLTTDSSSPYDYSWNSTATSDGATTVADGSASGGASLKFNAAPSGSCPSATPHTPDGSDGDGSCWPGANTVGIPTGTSLTAYTGACTINDAGTTLTIDAKDVRGKCAELIVYAGTVNISKSQLPRVLSYGTNAHISIVDSDVNGGTDESYSALAVVSSATDHTSYALSVKNSNVYNGKNSLECAAWCYAENNYMHDQYHTSSGPHEQAYLNSGGGTNSNVTLKHNSMSCYSTAGNCTADLALFGDDNIVSGITIDDNLFIASKDSSFSWSVYLGYQPGKAYPNPNHIVFSNNIFQRGANGLGGDAGPVSSWMRAADGGTGNIWSNNKWDDGTVLNEPPTAS